MGQDTNPMIWGARDRFQAHFVVKVNDPAHNLVAKTKVNTTGRFGLKKVSSVHWVGAGKLADTLNADTDLNKMISKRSTRDAAIFVEPTDCGVRIYTKWRALHEFDITQAEFDIYDRIAGHIKSI